jgi:hypothetical protein
MRPPLINASDEKCESTFLIRDSSLPTRRRARTAATDSLRNLDGHDFTA